MPDFLPIARRTFLTALSGAALAGCGDSPMQGGLRYIREGLFGAGDLDMSRAQVERVPFASIAVRLARGPQAFVVLGSYEGTNLLWVTADQQIIETHRGRVVRTVGFEGGDLAHTTFLTEDPVGTPIPVSATPECRRLLDFTPSNLFGLPVTTSFSYARSEDITILGATHATHVWEETGSAEDVKWSFTNTYWVDQATGFVWKSRQYYAPGQAVMEIVVLRPALEPKV